MLTHPTIDQLRELKLDGMADAFIELESQDRARELGHAEWLALLLDREAAIVEDRYGSGSTLITSQLPTDAWHEVIGEPTFADAILDRIVHNAYRLALDGPSIRKIKAGETDAVEPAPDTNGAGATKLAKGGKK